MRTILLLVLSTTLLVAAPIPKERKGELTDEEAILGMWESIPDPETNQPLEKAYQGLRWEFLPKNEARIWNPGDKAPIRVRYVLHPKENPKHLDWSFPTGDEIPATVQFPSLYELKGDVLQVTFGREVRPTKLRDGQHAVKKRVEK